MAVLLPGIQDRTHIRVETRRGTAIENQQEWELSAPYLAAVRKFEIDYPPPGACHSETASPVYNCHGLAFASRRTAISDSVDVMTILREDDYEQVDRASARPGDVVVYFAEGDAEHSGIVIRNGDVPWILSKWGLGKEVRHWLNRCPYDCADVRFYRVTR